MILFSFLKTSTAESQKQKSGGMRVHVMFICLPRNTS